MDKKKTIKSIRETLEWFGYDTSQFTDEEIEEATYKMSELVSQSGFTAAAAAKAVQDLVKLDTSAFEINGDKFLQESDEEVEKVLYGELYRAAQDHEKSSKLLEVFKLRQNYLIHNTIIGMFIEKPKIRTGDFITCLREQERKHGTLRTRKEKDCIREG